MKKYFITADVHGFFTIFKEALTKAGWQQDNPSHILVVAGDLFDRGPEARQLLDFVQSLGDRFIYVRGNHEDLMEDCIYELSTGMFLGSHHFSNGTVDTVMQLCNIDKTELSSYIWDRALQHKIYNDMKPILDWTRDKAFDYYEIGDYVIVHGWVPITPLRTDIYGRPDRYAFNSHWRDHDEGLKKDASNAPRITWERARWLNGMDCWKQGAVVPGKTVVCGHYHCSWGWSHIKQKYKEFPDKSKKNFEKSFQPFVDKGIIALDACTAYSGICNIITIEDPNLEVNK